jgi:hypothetical protein
MGLFHNISGAAEGWRGSLIFYQLTLGAESVVPLGRLERATRGLGTNSLHILPDLKLKPPFL